MPNDNRAIYRQIVADAAARHGVPQALASAQMLQESGFNPNAVSPKNATGIAQIMPDTARMWGVDPATLKDPHVSADLGMRIMAKNLKTYNGNVALALAAYNAGPGAVSKYKGVPPYKETQNYVRNIMAKAGMGGAPVKITALSTAGGTGSGGSSYNMPSVNVSIPTINARAEQTYEQPAAQTKAITTPFDAFMSANTDIQQAPNTNPTSNNSAILEANSLLPQYDPMNMKWQSIPMLQALKDIYG